MSTPTGHSAFGILLFQDIAAIPLIAMVPILGNVESRGGDPAWLKIALGAAAIAGVIVIGRYLTRPALRVIARFQIRELFTAFALLLVIGIAELVSLAGFVHGAGRLSRACSRRFRVPPCARKRHRALQGLLLGSSSSPWA